MGGRWGGDGNGGTGMVGTEAQKAAGAYKKENLCNKLCGLIGGGGDREGEGAGSLQTARREEESVLGPGSGGGGGACWRGVFRRSSSRVDSWLWGRRPELLLCSAAEDWRRLVVAGGCGGGVRRPAGLDFGAAIKGGGG